MFAPETKFTKKYKNAFRARGNQNRKEINYRWIFRYSETNGTVQSNSRCTFELAPVMVSLLFVRLGSGARRKGPVELTKTMVFVSSLRFDALACGLVVALAFGRALLPLGLGLGLVLGFGKQKNNTRPRKTNEFN